MKEPIRVLQILGIVANGGVEAVIMNYYRHIDKTKIQFDFVVHNDADENYIREAEKLGAQIYKVTPYNRNIFKFIFDIYKIIKVHHYQIVHCNMNALSGFALFAAYLANAKIRILHNHTTDSKEEKLRSFIKRMLRPFAKIFANQYWACSNLAAEWMYGKKVVEDKKITIINNAIDLGRFKFDEENREKIRKELGLENSFVVGHVGRFMKQKNHEFLIDIFNEVIKRKENARLLLIGDGKLRPQIELKVKELGISNKVIFLGNRNDVADLYNSMDVFVLPSLYEGLGMVAIEAQVNSLHTIVSTEIPIEAKISEYIKFISLHQPLKDWLNEIENAKRKDLNINDELLKKFDIKQESRKLENLYLEF